MLQIVYFVQTYGKEAEIVLQKALDFHTQGTDKEIALIKGEALFTLENEMVVTLADFWVRRTGKLYFNRASIPALLPEVANVFADYLEWTDAEKNTHLAEWETLFAQNMAWKKE
jgi:glycerol-3-phosphate dehydrogenase